MITAKNTSGTAIILIRVTYRSPSGPNQVSAAGPSAQPASAPSTKPATTRCQNGMRNQALTNVIEAIQKVPGSCTIAQAGANDDAMAGKARCHRRALSQPA